MTNKYIKILNIIIIIFILIIAFHYRVRSYNSYPPLGDTYDEFAYSWQGLSLIKTGIPTSWSFIPDYAAGHNEEYVLTFNGLGIEVDGVGAQRSDYNTFPKPLRLVREMRLQEVESYFPIVSPYLEQPPLGGLLISFPLVFAGVDNFADVDLLRLRYPFVIYGVLSTFLVIILANMWYGRRVGLVSGLLYSTVPTVVIGSRLALPENILTLLILLELVLLEAYFKNKNNTLLLLVYGIVFISPLIKPFGLAAALITAGSFAIRYKDYNKAIITVIVGILSFLTYFLYGLYYDKNTFIMTLDFQSKRFFAGPHILLYKIVIPRITKLFLDGWIFFGWLAIFVSAYYNSKKHTPLLISVFSYLFVIIFFGGEDFGWYRFPLYPFLVISAGFLFIEIVKKASFFLSSFFVLTAVSTGFVYGLGIYEWSGYLFQFRLFLTLSVTILVSNILKKNSMTNFLHRGFLIIIFILSLYLNTRIINNLSEIWPLLGEGSGLIINRQ